jgi:hypothetical protein
MKQKKNFEKSRLYYNMNKNKKESRIKLYSTVMTQQPFAFKKNKTRKITIAKKKLK